MGAGVSTPTLATNQPAPAGSDPRLRAEAIYGEQVRHLYGLSRLAYVGTLISAGMIVVALWGVVPGIRIGWWLTAALVMTGIQYALYHAFIRRPVPDADARRWAVYFMYGVAVMGLLWGFVGSALYPTGSMPHEFLVMFVIGGLVVSAMVVLAPVHQAFLAFAGPALLPTIATVYLQGTTLHFYMGTFLLAFFILMLIAGSMVSEMIRDSLGMKFENSELLAQLSETHAASRQANAQLNEQVYAQRVTAEQLRQASQKLSALIEASPLAIVVRDTEGRVESWNGAAERIFGWNQEELRGKNVPFLPPGQEDDGTLFPNKILSGETVSGVELVRMRKDGRLIDVSISAALVHDVSGRPTGYLTMMADISERRRAEQQQNLVARVTMLLTEAQSVEDAIPRVIEVFCDTFGFVYGARWVLDRQNMLMRFTESWTIASDDVHAFLEHSKARIERPGAGVGLNRRVWATGAPAWLADLSTDTTLSRRDAALAANLRSAFAFPITVGGEFYGVIEFFARQPREPDEAILAASRTISGHIGQFIARKQAERNLQFVASHDALTGLFNRSMFGQRLQQALAQAHRHERKLAVLFIDLDGFKLINDALGHDAGDALLAELAERLRICMREGDTLGRMGGDEFVVLIEGYEHEAQLVEVARKVVETVAQPFMLRDTAHNVTASIGIAAYPQDGREAQDLLKNADIAMYRAKEQGKNNFQFHSAEMNTHLVERIGLETALRRALERGELLLYYQPRVSLRESKVIGVEALVRWLHPTQGLMNPHDFVQIAEDTGLFAAIGEWVVRTACTQLRAWQQQGIGGLRVSVNFSMRQFGQDNLIERLREAVHDAGIEPQQLEIEITESMLMRHTERAAKLLAQVKELGARVVIDDFGTGYSSLASLRRFPVDAVKIDRSLVAGLPDNADAAGVTRAVIAMARSLNLQVTAEAIETREQWDFLREHECDAMQGNYFCAAAPAETVTALLLQQAESVQSNVQQFRPWRAARKGEE